MSITNSEAVPLDQPQGFQLSKFILGVVGFPLVYFVGILVGIVSFILGFTGVVPGVLGFVIAEIIVLLLAFLTLESTLKVNKIDWKDMLYIKNFTFKNFFKGAGVGLSLYFIMQAAYILIGTIGGDVESSDTSTQIATVEGIGRYIVLIFLVPFVVPLMEELFFRGFIFGFIINSGLKRRKLALGFGIVFSSIMFGIVHQQGFDTLTGWFVVILTAVIGAVNCWLVHKTDSIWTAYASHMAYNLITSCTIILASMV